MDMITFRAMAIEDLPAIKQIEDECFTAPWTIQSYIHEITRNQVSEYIVAVLEDTIAAYCGSWCVGDEAQITTIATHPRYQRKGLGEAILVNMMALTKQKGAKILYLEVRVSNEGAQKLYQKLGFEQIGIRKKYYADNQEDAILMGVNLDGNDEGSTCTGN